LERLTANAKVATVLGATPASTDTVETEGGQMKQYFQKDEKISIKKRVKAKGCTSEDPQISIMFVNFART
jgi:hypothetical protein